MFEINSFCITTAPRGISELSFRDAIINLPSIITDTYNLQGPSPPLSLSLFLSLSLLLCDPLPGFPQGLEKLENLEK